MFSCQLCSHPRLIQIHAEVRQNTLVELETDFPGITICLPLMFCVFHALASELVLQTKCKHRNTVDYQNHIHNSCLLHCNTTGECNGKCSAYNDLRLSGSERTPA